MIAALLALIALLLHVALLLAAAPLLLGLTRRVRARMLGEAGPALMQPWRDLLRLTRKQPLVPDGVGEVFRAAPLLDFAASLAAAALVPGFAHGMAAAPVADLLVIGGLLALSRAARALAAIEAGTAPGGLAAGRSLAAVALAAPALLAVVFALALADGTSNIDVIAALPAHGAPATRGLALVALLLLAAAAPRDALVGRDHSGRQLALIEGAAALRHLLGLSLIVAAFAPAGMAAASGLPLLWPLAAAVWAGKVAVLAVVLAAVQTALPPPSPARRAQLSGVALALALLAALLLAAGQGAA